MSTLTLPLFPVDEYHVHLVDDGLSLHIDGLPSGPETALPPEVVRRGIRTIFNLLESRIRGLTCICLEATWIRGRFRAYSIWAQLSDEGFFLPMSTAANLFRECGLPFYQPSFLS